MERRESAAEGFGLDILVYAGDLGVVAVVGIGSISPRGLWRWRFGGTKVPRAVVSKRSVTPGSPFANP